MIMNYLPKDRISKPKSGYVAVKTLFLRISV
jgi:hypothetical protein